MTERSVALAGDETDRNIPRKQVLSWALWDWATQPFATVITTFVFTVYLTSELFLPSDVRALGVGDPAYDRGLSELSANLGIGIAIAGVAIALLAPVMGQRSDAAGKRKRWLFINTMLIVLAMGFMYFVQTGPNYFVLGVTLVAVGNVFAEIAAVNYNAMLAQVSTPTTVGRVSGLGWGFGYLGGIIMLAIIVFASLNDWFGVPSEGGLNIRLVAVACAVWTLLFALPLFFNVPEAPPAPRRERVGFFRSYVELALDIRGLYRGNRTTFWFLIASAIYRDGLAGVFTFGGVFAAVTFGFSPEDVIIFGVAANIVAGFSTILTGRLDDRFGASAVILASLGGIVASGVALFFLHDGGTTAFWVGGLALCLFVGPAQSASRSFLARVTPVGREGEVFGLYATTGRAASFLAPSMWAGFISVFGAQYWGILGIVIVVLAGFVFMLFVQSNAKRDAHVA